MCPVGLGLVRRQDMPLASSSVQYSGRTYGGRHIIGKGQPRERTKVSSLVIRPIESAKGLKARLGRSTEVLETLP